MNYIKLLFIFILYFISSINLTASSFGKNYSFLTLYLLHDNILVGQNSDIRAALDNFMINIRGISSILPEDYDGVEYNAIKMVESYEKKKSKKSSSDLIKVIEKYSKKILKEIQRLDCDLGVIVEISEASQSFLRTVNEIISSKDEIPMKSEKRSSEEVEDKVLAVVGAKESKDDNIKSNNFFEKLSEMPDGSIGAHYLALWDTLDDLKNGDFNGSDGLTAMDLAIHDFSNQFVESFSHQFAQESTDYIVNNCLLSRMRHNYNGVTQAMKEIIRSRMIELEQRI